MSHILTYVYNGLCSLATISQGDVLSGGGKEQKTHSHAAGAAAGSVLWLAHFLLPGNTFVAKEIQLVRICVLLLQQASAKLTQDTSTTALHYNLIDTEVSGVVVYECNKINCKDYWQVERYRRCIFLI